MKTINKTIICAAAALALAGCTKEMETPADQELRKMSFTGVVDHNAGTKTALTSDYNVIWTSGDQISVFANGNNSQFTASNIRASESGLEGGAATFEGMATVADVYYGVYPYNESATISENVVSTVLPTDQTAVAGSFAVGSNISVARSAEDDVLQFRNAGAIVGLTVNGEGISAIRLQSADGTAAMSGAVTVDVSGDTPVMALASGAVDYIRLVAAQPSDSNPDATGTLTSGQTYYFVVAPGEYNGLKLVFENAGLDATYTTTTAEVVTVERNGNKNLGAFTVGEEDWIVNTYADYELNGKTEADAFVASVPEGEKLELRNLTVTGSDINNDVLASLASRISSVRGVMTFDGIGNDDPDTWLDMNNFVSRVDIQGDIIFRNITNIVNPQGFGGYTAIGGDFIVENCPNFVLSWSSDLANISEIAGDLIIRGGNKMSGSLFSSLRKVGGCVELSGISDVWSLDNNLENGYPMMQIEQIGGDLVIKDNPALWSLAGFESLIHIGGNVVISGNNPKMPVSSGVVDGDDCIGLCLIKDLLNKGAISADATITLATGEDNAPVDIADVPSCNPDITARSYVIMGQEQLLEFLAAADSENKETVYDLFITGDDLEEGSVRDIDNRVAAIEGTLTFSDISMANGAWLSTDQFIENINVTGGIVFQNVQANINPNGLKMTSLTGDVVIDNCPNFPADWDPFTDLKEVGGDVRVIGPIKGFSARFFRALETVGGDFHIEGVDSFWDFTYGDTPGIIKSVGGDFTIIDCPAFTRDAKGFRGFDSIEHIGGNVTLRNTAVSFPRESSDAVVGLCIFKHYMETGVISADAIVTVEDSGGIVDMSTVASCTGLASPAGE